MERDPEECKVYCQACNGYLYSVSIYESKGQESMTVPCPYDKDFRGQCTGKPKKR